jgi:hypothetical protein
MNTKFKLILKNTAFKLSQTVALQRLKKIARHQPPIIKNKKKKKIIFNLLYGMYGDLMYWECGLAKALQLRGHDVKALICNKALTMCTTEYTIDSVHDNKTCQNCIDFSHQFLKTVAIPYATYQEYLSPKELQTIRQKTDTLPLDDIQNIMYKDVHVGALSYNAVIRYYKGYLSPNQAEYERILRDELFNAYASTDIAEKIVKNEKPDVLLTRHLGYSSWGSFAEYCTNHGVRICSPTKGYDKKTMKFDIFDYGSVNNAFERYYTEVRKQKPLIKKEEAELNDFMKNRITGTDGDTAEYLYQPGALDQQNISGKQYDRTYAIFPNVPWDASLRYANKGFAGVHDWVITTIDLFEKHPQYHLLLKIHPSELRVCKSEQTVLDYIKNHRKTLPSNVTIIPPETTISPYDLFKLIDVGIVYNGTIGLELILSNIPTIVAGRTHYGGKGFTYDVEKKEDYETILFGDIPKFDKKRMDLAKVYSYFFFIKSFVPYDYIIKDRRILKFRWKIKSLDDLVEGKNKYLDHICNYIAYDTIYQDW